MTRERPVNLDLTKFSFPVMALASITHRITGIILFAGVAFALYALDRSLESDQALADVKALMATPLGKFVVFGILAALAFHFVAGVKHLIMDFGIGETIAGGRVWSIGTIVLSVVLILLAGAWLW